MEKLTIILVLALAFSCRKPENRRCFKSYGSETIKELSLPAFNRLELFEQMEFELIQDSTDKLVILGGKNMVNQIEWEIDSEGLLSIRNKSKCNFLRNLKKKVKVEIHFTELINMHYEGTEPLYSKDTLVLPYFSMLLRDGSSSVNLCVKSDIIYADIAHGWGDYTLRGKCNYANLAIRSNGYANAFDLKIRDSLRFSSNSQGDLKVNANSIPARGQILVDGNVIYRGNPSEKEVKAYAKGKFIPE